MLGKWVFIVVAAAAILIYINWQKIVPVAEHLLR